MPDTRAVQFAPLEELVAVVHQPFEKLKTYFLRPGEEVPRVLIGIVNGSGSRQRGHGRKRSRYGGREYIPFCC